jgi:hypothetical protein
MKYLVLVLFILLVFPIFTIIVNAQTALDPTYCGGESNDYYVIPGEDICSRAPNACGNGYDELNTEEKMPNAQACMGDGEAGRAEKGCAGYVPACCYEMARTGDYTKCIGYWERLWCTSSQCATAESNGATDSQCGGDCLCSHASFDYCGDISPVPLESRLGTGVTPTVTLTITPTSSISPTISPTGASVSPTNTPTLTAGSCESKKLAGDYNCDNSVNDTDFTTWLSDFNNGKSTLTFFEYWRRARY